MRKLNNILTKILIVFVPFMVGIVIGKFINIKYFTVKSEIDLVGVSAVLATFIAAYIISHVLEKNKQDYRVEKDILIKKIERIYELVDSVYNKILDRKIELTEATSHLKRIRINSDLIFNLQKESKIQVDDRYQDEINTLLNELKNLLTNTPIIDNGLLESSNLPVTVKNNIIYLSDTRFYDIELKFDKLCNLFLTFELALNNA